MLTEGFGTTLGPMDNREIAAALFDLATLLEMDREPGFRVRAFRAAAHALEGVAEPAEELLRRGELTSVPGIGSGIARRVAELCSTGTIAELEEHRRRMPPGLAELARVSGVGPKTIERLWRELGLGTIEEVEAAARAGKLRDLPRFGAVREAQLLRALETRSSTPVRWKQSRALEEATRIVARLRAIDPAVAVEICGSLRRRCETVADIDLLCAAPADIAPRVLDRFTSAPSVVRVLARGDTKAVVIVREGMQVDLRVVSIESWGAALHDFTGSKAHNAAIRALAVRRGLKIDEYGVYDESGARLGGGAEADVFAAVGLPWIAPELRENRGEIEAAAAGTLPTLVELGDLRGDLHMHTVETDGKNTLEEMVQAAADAGHEYVAITDHSQALALTRGLTPERLAAQGRRIRELNERFGGRPLVLRGIEADILADGSVDLGGDVLGELDWVVASVHSSFKLPREEQTRRIVSALESGVVDCLGHPTGRIINRRPGYDIDLERVLAAARRVGAAVELNAFPDRLDLSDVHLRHAKAMGVPVVISSDSHSTRQLAHLRYGIGIARRAWLEAADIVNTLPARDLLARFAHHHRRAAWGSRRVASRMRFAML